MRSYICSVDFILYAILLNWCWNYLIQAPITPNETRPDSLEKTGNIRSKIRLDPRDFGNDRPPSVDDDSDLESIFKDKSVPQKRPRNIPVAEQPGSPDALSLLGDGGRGVDTGNDGCKYHHIEVVILIYESITPNIRWLYT